MDVIEGMTKTYAFAFGNYVVNNFFVFVLGAIFGKIVELSGAANSIADFVVGKLGTKWVIPAIIIAGGIMGYGGISVFVGLFTLYPLMFALFEKANISRTLAPGIYCAAAGSFTCRMPGAPAMQLLIPVQALGTNTFAAAVPGFIVGFIQIILEILFCMWYVKHTQKKGLGWEGWEAAGGQKQDGEKKKQPPFLLALIPMAILIAALGLLKGVPTAVGQAVGIVAALIFYIPYWRLFNWDVSNI